MLIIARKQYSTVGGTKEFQNILTVIKLRRSCEIIYYR